MFTGIVEELGTVRADRRPHDGGARIEIDAHAPCSTTPCSARRSR